MEKNSRFKVGLARRALMVVTLIFWLSRCLLAAPSDWQGTLDPSGANVTRPQFKTQTEIPGTEGTVGVGITTVDAGVKGWFDDDQFSLKSDEWVRDKVQRFASDWNVQLEPIRLGDYRGYLAEKPVSYSPGAWGDGGFRHAGVDAAGRGWLTNGEYVFAVEYWVGGDGVYTNAHKEVMEAEAGVAQQEARGILLGLLPHRQSAAPSEPGPVGVPPAPVEPVGPGSAPPSPPSGQDIPWATLVGTGTGLLVAVALGAALKKRAPATQTPSTTPQPPAAPTPAVYVLQVSSDHLELSQASPASLAIAVWIVDPASKTYRPATQAVIEVQTPASIPQLSLTRQPSPGKMQCQLQLTGPSSTAEAALTVAAQAGGSRHTAKVRITITEAYRLEFF